MTKFVPHLALNIIASGKLTFDERPVIQRVGWVPSVATEASPHERVRTAEEDEERGAPSVGAALQKIALVQERESECE